MSLENLEQDRAALQAVLDDVNAGRLQLRQGEEEVIADIKRRLRAMEQKLKRNGGA